MIPFTFRLLSKGTSTSRHLIRIGLSQRCFALATQQNAAAAASVVQRKVIPNEGFWEKNDRMQRPLSPHITIYKFELPGLLSGTHRFTGLAMSGIVFTVGSAALLLPGGAESYIDMIRALNLPIWVLAPAKCLIAFPLCYHTVNGVRHLIWDTGRGFEMKTLYKTGYFAVATSIALTIGIVAFCSYT
uniref:Succinate dehydrogenase cytochrome b560 subunit, mitochondrial n=1 Tax=Hydra vulgaris TaxID=6087 RepID=T2M689_HYDVU